MIPYFTSVSFHFGPFTIYTWGTFVALGILAGLAVGSKLAREEKIRTQTYFDDAFWMLAAAFLGARIIHVLFYGLATYRHDLLGVFKIWDGGWSSIGGIIGAVAAGLWLISRDSRLRGNDKRRYADVLASGFPIGMAIGRIGCFLIHDHPGTLSHSLLAVKFPTGSRYDLGLLESLDMFVLAAACFIFRKKLLAVPGRLTYFIGAWYGISRFLLDFLRATDLVVSDVRYFGLTPAQYGCLGLVGVCVYGLTRKKK